MTPMTLAEYRATLATPPGSAARRFAVAAAGLPVASHEVLPGHVDPSDIPALGAEWEGLARAILARAAESAANPVTDEIDAAEFRARLVIARAVVGELGGVAGALRDHDSERLVERLRAAGV